MQHSSRKYLIGFLLILISNQNLLALQDSNPSAPNIGDKVTGAESDDEKQLSFTFAGSKWRDVIEWLAESSGLALHIGELPTGTFTYTDDRSFTTNEAIDRINLFLLPEGYTLVRSGRLLSVINLSDPRSLKQLDSMARLVKIDELAEISDHDVVKCIFPLGELDAIDAVDELAPLNLFQPPAVFTKTNQVMITDTGAKLKTARTILSSFEPKTLSNGTVVKSFALKHVDAEDVLMVARPHLGLATGEMIGIDVSISADVKGKNIFVTGIEDKVQLIEGLVNAVDLPDRSASSIDSGAELLAHPVKGGNVEMVYDVLQTLLAGKTVRLSMDQTAGTIVALASPDIQSEIAQTVEQLQAAEAEFAIIPLKNIDPYFAISLLEEMLDLDEDSSDDNQGPIFFGGRGGFWGGGFSQQNNSKKIPPPKVDADPGNRRLFVRGRKNQIEQIRKIVMELDSEATTSGESLRLLPMRGAAAEEAVRTAVKFWKGDNPVFLFVDKSIRKNTVIEKVVNDQPEATQDKSDKNGLSVGELLTRDPNNIQPEIRCQITGRGLLLQCDDTKALDQFETLLRKLAGGSAVTSAPTVYYLKYTRPDAALRMLAELLDGGEAAKEAEGGTLVNGFTTGSSSSFLGSIISSREGTYTMINGTITVVADNRLNRLIAQGTNEDIELIEDYLKIIDKESSLTPVLTSGISRIIELEHVDAEEVAQTIRTAYAGRISGPSSPGQPQPRNNPQPRGNSEGDRGEDRDDNRNGDQEKGNPNQREARRNPGSGGGKPSEVPMTIAVHVSSNSIIVTAPEALLAEVEKLVRSIDTKSKQTVQVLKLPRRISGDLQQILQGKQPMPQPVRRENNSNSGTSRRRNR